MLRSRSKLVTLRDTISLTIFDDWVPRESEDCCTFHEQESGTLRLRLSIGQHEAADCSLDELIDALFFSEPSERLGDDLRLRFQVEPEWENGQEIFAYSWTIAVPVDGRRVRTAEFNYNVSAGREGDPDILSEIEHIDDMIRSARFAVDHGPTG